MPAMAEAASTLYRLSVGDIPIKNIAKTFDVRKDGIEYLEQFQEKHSYLRPFIRPAPPVRLRPPSAGNIKVRRREKIFQ
jgi:hypothetical protein